MGFLQRTALRSGSKSTRHSRLLPLALVIVAFCVPRSELLYAHGALIEYSTTTGIALQARYDTGQPMSEARISVFAPDNPAKPWLTGNCDEEGRFSFIPDPALSGTWSIQARLAGHGAMVHIHLDQEESEQALQSVAPGLNTGQRWLMAAAIIWGCIGTALYFSKRRGNNAHP